MFSPGYWQTGTLTNTLGRVFIPDGFNGSNPVSMTNVYDAEDVNPVFGFAGDMANARYLHATTLLNNGMALMVGGAGAGEVPVGQAELY